jgi:succinyl-CoA synthetase alpha subunit
MIGEIGGMGEEQAAAYLEAGYPKPVIAFIAGQTAPAGKQMGHAGAIISAGGGSTQSKYAALAKANARITKTFGELIAVVRQELSASPAPVAKRQVAGNPS